MNGPNRNTGDHAHQKETSPKNHRPNDGQLSGPELVHRPAYYRPFQAAFQPGQRDDGGTRRPGPPKLSYQGREEYGKAVEPDTGTVDHHSCCCGHNVPAVEYPWFTSGPNNGAYLGSCRFSHLPSPVLANRGPNCDASSLLTVPAVHFVSRCDILVGTAPVSKRYNQ